MKKQFKLVFCAAAYLAAIAGLSALFISYGPIGTAPGSTGGGEIPDYHPVSAVYREELSDLNHWTADPGQGGYLSPDGTARFFVTQALAYQEDLAAYAQSNTGSIEMEKVEVLSGLSRGVIGGRETYVYEYADLGQNPVQYRKIYLFNADGRTYGAMGVSHSREALARIDFDSIVAQYKIP